MGCRGVFHDRYASYLSRSLSVRQHTESSHFQRGATLGLVVQLSVESSRFLVEDNPVIRENLAAAMEELAPVQVVGFADDEPAAMNWIAANPEGVDLLLIDLLLKRGSGLVVLRAASKLTKACKVVVSNYATPDMRRKCLELGADRVFDKSNEIEALIAYCARLNGDETGPGGLLRQ